MYAPMKKKGWGEGGGGRGGGVGGMTRKALICTQHGLPLANEL
jgi:hypothetical protein